MDKVIEFMPLLSDGGAQALVRDYVELMDRSKIQFKIVTLFPDTKSANYRTITKLGVETISLYPAYNTLYRGINKVIGTKVTSHRLLKVISRERPSVIHVHMALLKYLEPIKQQLQGIKLFYTCHNLPSIFFSGINAPELTAAKSLITNNGLRIIALHDAMAYELNSLLGIDNTIVVKNGVNIDKFRDIKESKEDIRRELGIPLDSFVVGHVGRFSKQKNHSFIIEVFAELDKRINRDYLILIGDGETVPEIKANIHELSLDQKVTILSHRDDVHRLLKAFDVFLFPSRYEGLGIALVEAQAAGLRCVVSDTIPRDAMLLDTTIALSLENPADKWVDVILDFEARQKPYDNLDTYDMRCEVQKLQHLYLREPC